MDRREALKALVSMPAVSRISVAELKPDDVIVVECDEFLTLASKEHIRGQLEAIWPNRKIVVLEKSLRMKVVSGG